MEMEGRAYSEFYRNTSEELFMKSLMEGSIGMAAPNMEMLGFKSISNNFRADSEELFKSWLTNGENHGYNAPSIAHRTRHASRRISTELASLTTGGALQKKRSNDVICTQNTAVADERSSDPNQHSTRFSCYLLMHMVKPFWPNGSYVIPNRFHLKCFLNLIYQTWSLFGLLLETNYGSYSRRNAVDKGWQVSNLHLAKAWFNSSQPMTRSRSSELRRRYAAMQNSQTSLGMEAMNNVSGLSVNTFKQEFANPNGFDDVSMSGIPNQFNTFMSPSNSSSTFNNPQMDNIDNVSSVVSMLKGTLERKKLRNQENHIYEVLSNTSLNQGQENCMHEVPRSFQDLSQVEVKDQGVLQTLEGALCMDMEGFLGPTNPIQTSTVSRDPSQSESSAAAPVVSNGFDPCDGPTNSGQTMSICESSRKQIGNGRSLENGSKSQDISEQIYDNLNDDRKLKGSLIRYGSVNSAGSVEKGDPTKKRRVERSRKMAEAKERNLIPAIPSDMQSILKRCENLEKEVRSLKLNLSFMNRKDSEQTKQIEELQKQNEELTEEKERLLEEIERIISEPGRM